MAQPTNPKTGRVTHWSAKKTGWTPGKEGTKKDKKSDKGRPESKEPASLKAFE